MTEMNEERGGQKNGEVLPSSDNPEGLELSATATGARPDQAVGGMLTPSQPPGPPGAEVRGPPATETGAEVPAASEHAAIEAGGGGDGGGRSAINLRYYFTVDAPLRVPEPIQLAKGPEGTRINVVYNQNSQVTTDPGQLRKSWAGSPDKPKWGGLAGRIASGGDFYLVRTDGILELDGRVTIVSDDGVIIEARYTGLVDLYRGSPAAEVPLAAVEGALAHPLPGGNPEHGSFAAVAAALRAALDTAVSEHGSDAVESLSRQARQKASHAIASNLPDVASASAQATKAIREVVTEAWPNASIELATVNTRVEEALRNDARGISAVETAITRNFRNGEFDAYENFLGGRYGETELPVQLSVSFETSSGPWSDSPDEDMSWVAKHYLVNQKKFWKYRRLVRNPFLGIGKLAFAPQGPGRIPLAKHIRLDVFEIDGSSLLT